MGLRRWLDPWVRNRLFRKYVVPFVAVVSWALLTNGLLEIYFTYQESRAALGQIQREKANAAALRIEQFVREIERQMGWTTQPQVVAPAAALEQRKIEYIRLQRQVLPITEVAFIDGQGREQLRVSRLAMDVMAGGGDASQEPRFRETRGGRVWYGPVYFRKESEPYMTLAIPHGTSATAPVTAAEVNLKFIWDVVSQIKIGRLGQAYVVDRQGHLIAHPDIGLVLRKTDLSTQPQVQAARAAAASGGGGADDATVATDLAGRNTLVAHTVIAPLGWIVFVEQPLVEAFAPLRGAILRTGLLMLLGVFVSVVASLALARKISRPIQALQAGAARIGGGELAHRIDVRTKDELQELGEQFNRMAGALQESYATLEQKVEDRTRELSETLEQQTATAEILRVISGSPTDVRPIFETIVRSAATLCDASFSAVVRFDGERIHGEAAHNIDPSRLALLQQIFPMPPAEAGAVGAAITGRRVVHIEDFLAVHDPIRERAYAFAQAQPIFGFRTVLVVPMLREGVAVGAIVVWRPEVRPFTDKQIALLQTFADQAVIAIENVRLFKELEARNAAVTESLDQQTATAEILRVIASSPTDEQPVLDAVAESAARLCGATDGLVYRVHGDQMEGVAHFGDVLAPDEFAARPLTRGTVGGQAILDRRVRHVPDVLEEYARGELPEGRKMQRQIGYRTVLAVPLLRDETAIGVITIRRLEVVPFTDKQIALLQTFADQAVIAIENVRLFKELESRNAALTESLGRQMATAEILRVISASPTDVQPVFDAIAASAVRLCNALHGAVFRFDGRLLHLAAHSNVSPAALEVQHRRFPSPPSRRLGSGRAILDRAVVHIPDLLADPDYQEAELIRAIGFRSALWVPMLRDGEPTGVIAVSRATAGPFTEAQIALLQTFADQAVIAIENVRLFTELQARTGELTRSVEEMKALGEVGRALSSTLDLPTVLDTILARANVLAGTDGGAIYEFLTEDRRFHLRRAADTFGEEFVALLRANPIALGEGAVGRAGELREPVQIPDIRDPAVAYDSSVRQAVLTAGYRALLAVPLLGEDEVVGALIVNRRTPGEFEPRVVDVLRTFGTQSALAIQNARLFREIEDKSRQLEAANRHKDEFLASMSHELRTPLNAVIGFSEVLLEKMFGDVNDKQEEYLRDILASGRHLLSLINDILDLAKIEAGRMELDVEEFDVAQAVDNAVVLVRERATRKGLTLVTTLDRALGAIRGDQRKIKQVMLNLLSNAVKFTPEGGQIEVRAQRMPDHVEIAVVDTGIGIAAEDLEAVFEEFRQVGTDYAKKHEGTGLGLTLSRKFVELHGGRIWVKSQLGQGSTFAFSLPGGPWPTS